MHRDEMKGNAPQGSVRGDMSALSRRASRDSGLLHAKCDRRVNSRRQRREDHGERRGGICNRVVRRNTDERPQLSFPA
jgi:hypothetical protein